MLAELYNVNITHIYTAYSAIINNNIDYQEEYSVCKKVRHIIRTCEEGIAV